MKSFTFVKAPPLPEPLSVEDTPSGRFYFNKYVRYPSITTVLGAFGKEHLQAWRERVGDDEANKISRRASTRGDKLHGLLEAYIKGEQNFLQGVMPDTVQSVRDMQRVLDAHVDNIHYVECQLRSNQLGVAGRTDVIGEYDQVLSVIDYKTSIYDKKEEWIEHYFEQAAFYALSYLEMVGIPINQIVIIVQPDHGCGAQVLIRNPADYINSMFEKIWKYKNVP